MPRFNALRPQALLSLCLAGLCLIFATSASAEVKKRRIYRGRVVRTTTRSIHVPLQPFTLDPVRTFPARNTNVAFYAPHAIPRAQHYEHSEEDVGPAPEVESRGDRPTVSGNRAVLRNGVAYAPSNAPSNVKSAIWAVNSISRKPYHWGGGHGSFTDSGYDCSGTVSFALHHAGVLNSPLPSSDLLRYGERGRGRWITVYSRRGHTFAMIAGLRLDTTDFRYGGDVGPRWHTDGRSTGGFEARHPVGL